MLTIRPPRCRIICRDTALVTRKVPFRFVRTTVSKSSSERRIRRLSRVTPALFTRTSIRPCSEITAWTAASTRGAAPTSNGGRTPSTPAIGQGKPPPGQAPDGGQVRRRAEHRRRDIPLDPAHQSGEDLPRPDFEKRRHPHRPHPAHAFLPAHGRDDLPEKGFGHPLLPLPRNPLVASRL